MSNWLLAERYVSAFYDVVLEALNTQDVLVGTKVSEAFSIGEKNAAGVSIVNAFEASLLVYYIKGAPIR